MSHIYLDNAATTPVDPQVLQAMLPYLKNKYGNPSSIHSWGKEARIAIEKARQSVADFLGCKTGEVIFTSCATEANNLALKGVVEATKAKHLIISSIEHHCVLDTAEHLDGQGVEVTWLKVDKFGQVSLKEIEKAIRPETALISVMYVNNEVATILPIRAIGQKLKAINSRRLKAGLKQIYFHTDAVQAIQYLDCNVNRLGIDLLSLSAHKFYGPKGIGALYVRSKTPITRQQDGGSQEFGLRAGTENVAGIIGLAKAIHLVAENKKQGLPEKVKKLSHYFIKEVLTNIKGVELTGHQTNRAPHIVSFVIHGVEGESLLLMLDSYGIAASSGSACTAGDLRPSHVLSAMGVVPEVSHGSLRLSLSSQTTKEEIDYTVESLVEIVKKLRILSPLK